jgi:hypothetical protein
MARSSAGLRQQTVLSPEDRSNSQRCRKHSTVRRRLRPNAAVQNTARVSRDLIHQQDSWKECFPHANSNRHVPDRAAGPPVVRAGAGPGRAAPNRNAHDPDADNHNHHDRAACSHHKKSGPAHDVEAQEARVSPHAAYPATRYDCHYDNGPEEPRHAHSRARSMSANIAVTT